MNIPKKGRTYGAPAVEQAVRLMELLCASENALGISEIAQQIGVNKHTTFRLLSSLEKQGWVVRQPDAPKYAMTLRAFHHTSKPVSRMNVRVAAEGPLRALWRETGQSTYLSVLDDDQVLHLEYLEATTDVKIASRVGGRYKVLHCSAPGKIMLAHAGEPLLQRLLAGGLERFTRRTICGGEKLRRHLRQVRKLGYATDLEECLDGCVCFAVPVFDYKGEVVATLGQSVLTYHFTSEGLLHELGPKIVNAGKEISKIMGHESKESL